MWEILPYCMAKAGVDIFTKCLSLGKKLSHDKSGIIHTQFSDIVFLHYLA